ncbi:perlucin-like isoform X1 [Ostrea edulis]|uniref:perlucin-like isoform X1 n=1 Tax=Ostrea edulis TaxID=37623 RepID=UPI0024AE9A51|nr:perlucin-like isoform X1 [Ostrea edulis]
MSACWANFVVLLLTVGTVNAGCPNGFIQHDDSCYLFFHSTRASWAEAMMYCQVFKSHLAVIESEREQNFIEGLLLREYHRGLPDGCWIDGTDALVEGEWVWTTTGKAISTEDYQKWFPGEPNSLGRSGEDCLDLLHHEKYSWNDERCEVMNNFLCETSATDDGINVG